MKQIIFCTAMVAGLAACGGGAGGNEGTGAGSGAGGTGSTGTTEPVVTQDLKSFAAVWTSYELLKTLPAIVATAGNTGKCTLGGEISYDATASLQRLTGCGSPLQRDRLMTGSFSTAYLTYVAPQKTYTLKDIQADFVATAAGKSSVQLQSGDADGSVSETTSGFAFYIFSSNLGFRLSPTRRYDISNYAANGIEIVPNTNGFDWTDTRTVFTTSSGESTWQVTVMSPLHLAADGTPDRGTLMIVRLGAIKALTATFNANAVVLDGGETLAGPTSLQWSDQGLVSALAAAWK